MSFDPDAAASPDSGVFGLDVAPADAGVVLIPVPFEATTSYRGGTAGGPKAVLEASKQVDLFDLDTGHPWKAGIAMLPESAEVRGWNESARALAKPIIDAGGAGDARALEQVNALCARMNGWVEATAKQWLGKGKLVGLVGGDHSTPFGLIKALSEAAPGLGILHLDAHADLRDAYEGFTWSHASIMHNVMTRLPGVATLVQVGIRDFGQAEYDFIVEHGDTVHTFFDSRLARNRLDGQPWREEVDAIVGRLPQHVYLSFDIDGLEPTLCPHTGTPVPGGLDFHQAVTLIEGVVRAGKRIIGFDLNEVAPGPDDEWDGNVGARLLYKMIGWALESRAK